MKVLVTGGAGFVGSYLTLSLVNDGYEVTVLDDFSTGPISRVIRNSKLNYVKGSILDEELVNHEVRKADQIFHLAATVGVAKIMESPLKGLETNVLGSEIVIRTCSKWRKSILITSSSEIYGKNKSHALDENSERIVGVPQISRWSYSDSKAIEEAFAFAYMREHGLELRLVRLFNTVGPGQLGDFGMVIPRMVESAISNKDLVVHGNGEQKRCFMHVRDAVDGIRKAMMSDVAAGKVYNLGNSEEISIKNLATKIIKKTRSSSRILFKSYEEIYGNGFEDMERRFPSIERARKDLGWVPTTTLDDILDEIIQQKFESK